DVTMTNSSTAPQANFVTAVEVLDLPFIFRDMDMARTVCKDDEFLGVMREAYAEKGFYLIDLLNQGFRTTTTDTLEAHTPDDFKGFNIRTMENANHMAIWKALGANPTPIAYTELYTALQQGTVRGQENPYENISVKKFYEQQDYIIGTNHVLQVIAWIANLDWYNSLDAECQEAFNEAALANREFTDKFIDDNQAVFVKEFEDYGCTVYDLTPDEIALFQAKTDSVYATIEQHMKDINSPAYDTLIKVAAEY
ncbi:MAG: TRAP transporter substrate-binding protein, partial [Oscillospiraceae bacterium]